MHIDFQKCLEKIAASLNEYCNRWCKREHVEGDALKDWKLNIFKIIDRRISFYSHNTNMLPRKPKISYRYMKSCSEGKDSKYVYPAAGHVISDNLKIISYSRIRSIIAKGRKYRFPVQLQHILLNFVNVGASESILSVILKRIGT